MKNAADPLKIYLVAGEESGDQLGAELMRALRRAQPDREIAFVGLGGARMQREGLESLFPMEEISVMGILPVIAKLPGIIARAYRVIADIVARDPDCLVIIDSPDFTQPIAKRVHKRAPHIPIVNYVSPSVWAWRPGRARKMRGYIDHVLALKPFEPAAHQRLGGPPCSYVGHPLVERRDALQPAEGERRPIGEGPLELLVLPGSRRSELSRLAEPFAGALARFREDWPGAINLTLPAVAHLAPEIVEITRDWPIVPQIVEGEDAKFAAFRRGQAALAASGTVTLELALSGVPMVVAYKVSRLEEQLKYLIKVDSIVLVNLILGEKLIGEFIQDECAPEPLAAALRDIAMPGPARDAQIAGFARLDAAMDIGDEVPSARAARLVLETMVARGAIPAR
ncbi:MAG: lipid-A-disaccharide synthase [Salinarimonas sp.]|nr:lipid-A-disaccharide synthase [Salinarimonas sp.]